MFWSLLTPDEMKANESVMYLDSRIGEATGAPAGAGGVLASGISRSMSSFKSALAEMVRSACTVETLDSLALAVATVVLDIRRFNSWGSLAAIWDQVGSLLVLLEGGGLGLHVASVLIPNSLCLCDMKLLLKRFCWLESRSCNALALLDHGEKDWEAWTDSGTPWLKAIWDPALGGWKRMLLEALKSADVKCIAGDGALGICIALTGLGRCIDCRKGDNNKPGGGSLGFKWAPTVMHAISN